MDTELTDVRAAADDLSRLARPLTATLHEAVVALCQGDQEPVFGSTARLLNAVAALERAIVGDIPALIYDVEVSLSKAARLAPQVTDDGCL